MKVKVKDEAQHVDLMLATEGSCVGACSGFVPPYNQSTVGEETNLLRSSYTNKKLEAYNIHHLTIWITITAIISIKEDTQSWIYYLQSANQAPAAA